MADISNNSLIADFYDVQAINGASGGQGRVRRAKYRGDSLTKKGSEVALKLMSVPEEDSGQWERLEKRTRELTAITHPNVVRYLGCFRTRDQFQQDTHVVIQEFLHGETLKERIARNPLGLDADEAIFIVRKAAEGLAYTAERGIIHRDVKPGNIFICLDDAGKITGVKLIDFEIAKQQQQRADVAGTTGTASTVASGHMKGTYDYMAPDFIAPVFRGDELSDIFSLGVVLHEALTGRTPYHKIGGRGFEPFMRWQERSQKLLAGGEGLKELDISRRISRVLIDADDVLRTMLAPDRRERCPDFNSLRGLLAAIELRRIYSDADKSGRVKSYTLLRFVGKGGFGEVYKARQDATGELVAVKRLIEEQDGGRFQKEAKVLEKLHDPDGRFVNFVDYFLSKADPFFGRKAACLVMGYLPGMPGGSLSDAIERANGNGLDVRAVLKAFIRYAQGLAVLHRDGIIHRDIKPSNLYYPDGHPEKSAIMDFGIVRDLSGTTTRGTLPGTLDYMPFELFPGNHNRGDARSDIYALGLCLYRALTGMRAYPVLPKDPTSAVVEIVRRKNDKEKPNFYGTKNLPSKVVKPITKILNDMTDIRWSKRLGNAYIVAGLLQRVLELLPSEAVSPTCQPRPVVLGTSTSSSHDILNPSTISPIRARSWKKLFVRLSIVTVALFLVFGAGVYLRNRDSRLGPDPKLLNCLAEITGCRKVDGSLDLRRYASFAFYDFPEEFLHDSRVKDCFKSLGKAVEATVERCISIEPIENRQSRLDDADAILKNKWSTVLLGEYTVRSLVSKLQKEQRKIVFSLRNRSSADILVGNETVVRNKSKLLEFEDPHAAKVVIRRDGFVPIELTYDECIQHDGKTYDLMDSDFTPKTLKFTVCNKATVSIRVRGQDVSPGQKKMFALGMADSIDDWYVVADGYERYKLQQIIDGRQVTVSNANLTPRMVGLDVPVNLGSDIVCKVDAKPVSNKIRPGEHKVVYSRGDYVDQEFKIQVRVGSDYKLEPPSNAWTPTQALKALVEAQKILEKNALTDFDIKAARKCLVEASGVVAEANRNKWKMLAERLEKEIARHGMERRIEDENEKIGSAEKKIAEEQWDDALKLIEDCVGLTPENKKKIRDLKGKVDAGKKWIVGTIVNAATFPVIINGETIDQGTSRVFRFMTGKLPEHWVATAVGYDDKKLSDNFNGKVISLKASDFTPREVVMTLPMLEEGVSCVCNGKKVVDSVKLSPRTGYSCVYMRPGYEKQTVHFDAEFNKDGVLPSPGEWKVLLVVVSVPGFSDDVECKIDGQKRTVRERIELEPGKHSLEYSRFGYQTQTMEFEIKPGISEKLAPPTEWKVLPVEVAMPYLLNDVKCKLDGRERTSGERMSLVPGIYSLEYSRTGYEVQRSELAIKLGERQEVPPPGEWKAQPVEIEVPMLPDGVTCRIDEQDRFPGEKVDLRPGMHLLEYKRLGYETQTFEFLIEAGVARRLSSPQTWRPLPVKITVPELPVGVKCKINDTDVPSGGSVLLSVGTCSLKYSRFGYQTQSFLVAVELGRPMIVPPPGKWNELPVEIGIPALPGEVKCKIDGQERFSGKKIELKPGKYLVEYSRLGYQVQISELTVKLGRPETILPPGEWKALPVEIMVPVSPDDVSCTIDGLKRTSGEKVSLLHDSIHSCVYKREGYETQTIQFKVRYNDTGIPSPNEWKSLPVEIALPMLSGGVTCKIDGRELTWGEKIELKPGKYSLEYGKADHEPMKSTIVVEPGRPQTLAAPGKWKPTPGLQALVAAEEAWNNRNWKGVEDSIAKANVVSEDAVLRKKAIQKALEKYNSIKGFIDAADTAKQYGDCKLYLESLGQAVKSGYMLTEADKRDAKEIYESKKGDLDATIMRTKEMPAWKQHKANRDILRLEEEEREITRLYMEIKAAK